MDLLFAWLWVAVGWLTDSATEYSLLPTSTPLAGFVALIAVAVGSLSRSGREVAWYFIVSIKDQVRAWLCFALPCRVIWTMIWWMLAALWSFSLSILKLATSAMERLAHPVPFWLLCLCAAEPRLISRLHCIPYSEVVVCGLVALTTYFISPAPWLNTFLLLGLMQVPKIGPWGGRPTESTQFLILAIWLVVDHVLVECGCVPCSCIRGPFAFGLLLLEWIYMRLQGRWFEASMEKMTLYHISTHGPEIKASGRMHAQQDGWVGAGIYFAESVEAARAKSQPHSFGHLVIAKVRVGARLEVDVRRPRLPKETLERLFSQGYDSIHVVGPRTGPEVVVFNSDQAEIVDIVEDVGPLQRTTTAE